MINLYEKVKVAPITKGDLARKIAMLIPGECLYFWSNQNDTGYGEEVYGVRFIEEFEAWVILINIFGGGASTVIDYYPGTTDETELIRLTDCLHKYCNYIGTHSLFVAETD